jgi:peptidase C39-like protein
MPAFVRRFVAATFACIFLLISYGANSAMLGISPVAQQTPEWCWAASAQMVFQHFGFPNLNPAGNYQCGVVAAQGGPCIANCGFCLNAGGTTYRVAAVMQMYAVFAQQMTGFQSPNFRPQTSGILSPHQIISQIDNGGPIIAGITPSGVPYPPGLGFSQHAVVIVGYTGNAGNFNVIINDPYPYPPMAIPYVNAGGTMISYGQYVVPYALFTSVFRYGNSIVFR